MQIDRNVPAIQLDARKQTLLATFVVLGPGHSDSKAGHLAGTIKTVYFGPYTDSPLLVIEKKTRNTRMIGVKGLHICSAEAAMGTRFLRDLYAEEGRLAHYDAFCARELAIRDGKRVGPLPDAYLPKKVLEWRAGKADAEVFELPPLDVPAIDIEDEADEPAPMPTPAPASKPGRRRKVEPKPLAPGEMEELDELPPGVFPDE